MVHVEKPDFESFVKPQLVNRLDMNDEDVSGQNAPNRIVMLGDKPMKHSELKQDLERYWKIKGADTPEKRAWDTPWL